MGKTITTYLIDGDPKGSQYVFISNKICQMFVIPRSNLSILNERTDLQTPAFYILLGEDENVKPKAYIGETENFKERVKYHDSKKSFWQKALVFISKDAAMTKADVKYLEYRAIEMAQTGKQYSLEDNKQIPNSPNLPEYQKDNMDDFFKDICFLASFIGCNIFETTEIKHQQHHFFYLKGRGCDATGLYGANGFTILENSIISPNVTPSFSWKEKRKQLISEYATEQNGKFVLNAEKQFPSPSTAATFCLGRSSNGWTEWKDKEGRTLDTVYRKQLD